MNLNSKQRKAVIVGVVLFILMGLIPPWTNTFNGSSMHSENSAGYSLIFLSPEGEANSRAFGVKIDIARLVIQWLVLVAATGLRVFMVKTQDKE